MEDPRFAQEDPLHHRHAADLSPSVLHSGSGRGHDDDSERLGQLRTAGLYECHDGLQPGPVQHYGDGHHPVHQCEHHYAAAVRGDSEA